MCILPPSFDFFANLTPDIEADSEIVVEESGIINTASMAIAATEDEEYGKEEHSGHFAKEQEAQIASKCKRHESERARIARENVAYDKLPETQPVRVADGYVTFTRHFKYLGSYISYNLHDDFNVESHIASASQFMGALKNVWDNPHMDFTANTCSFTRSP